MLLYEQRLDEILRFTTRYDNSINCHLVDFFTDDLWDKCLPDPLKCQLERNFETEDPCCWTEYASLPALNDFLRLAESLSLLHTSSIISTLDNILEDSPCPSSSGPLEFPTGRPTKPAPLITVKKQYEVETFGNVIANLTKLVDGLVVDAGAGKAYLSTYLAMHHQIPVLAIDSSSVCHVGTMLRQSKLKQRAKKTESKKVHSYFDNVRYVVDEIDDRTDYTALVNEYFSDWPVNKNLVLTGLHTCGSLAQSLIQSFLSTKDCKVLCIIPCCYHLASDTFGKAYSITKNARMLAQQSLEKSILTNKIPTVLFYRAVLQVLLRSMGLNRVNIGRGGPTIDFPRYAEWALLKAGIDKCQIPPAKDLESLYHSHAAWKIKFDIFQMMRIYMGPVVEASIILDRMVYLQNSGICSKLGILRLFDPLVSPRCYAILAIK